MASAFSGFRKAVAEATHGDDQPWFGRVVLDLLAQFADMHIDDPVDHSLTVIVKTVEQFVAGEDLTGGSHQTVEQLELGGGQVDDLAVFTDLELDRIELKSLKAQHRVGGLRTRTEPGAGSP